MTGETHDVDKGSIIMNPLVAYKILSVILMASLLLVCSSKRGEIRKAMTISEAVTKGASNLNQQVRLKGRIIGYHHLLIYDNERIEPQQFAVYLWTSIESRKVLVGAIKDRLGNQPSEDGNFHIDGVVDGLFEILNHNDPMSRCYVPDKIISSHVQYCLALESVIEVRSLD